MPARYVEDHKMNGAGAGGAEAKLENELREKEVRLRAALWLADSWLFGWSIFCAGSMLSRLQHMPVESIWVGEGLIPRQHVAKLRQEIAFIALVWVVFLLVAILRKTRLFPIRISTSRVVYTCLMTIAAIALTQLYNWCERHRHSDVITLEMHLFYTCWLMTIHICVVLVMLVIDLFATNHMPKVPFDPRTGIYPL